jgi:hypothetical protein
VYRNNRTACTGERRVRLRLSSSGYVLIYVGERWGKDEGKK